VHPQRNAWPTPTPRASPANGCRDGLGAPPEELGPGGTATAAPAGCRSRPTQQPDEGLEQPPSHPLPPPRYSDAVRMAPAEQPGAAAAQHLSNAGSAPPVPPDARLPAHLQPPGQAARPPRARPRVPGLNFSRLCRGGAGGPAFARNVPGGGSGRQGAAGEDDPDASRREAEADLVRPVHPGAAAAPDGRCYVYKPVAPQVAGKGLGACPVGGDVAPREQARPVPLCRTNRPGPRLWHPRSRQERHEAEALIARLPAPDAAAAAAMWASLLAARRDAEAVAARGVRVARDVSRDWQETVSELIERVVAQDGELAAARAELAAARQQLAAAATCGGGWPAHAGAGAAAAAAAAAAAVAAAAAAAQEEPVATAERLRRQRDRLAKDNAELAAAGAAARGAADAAAADAARARAAAADARAQAGGLARRHAELLRHHIAAAACAGRMEDELCAGDATAGSGERGGCGGGGCGGSGSGAAEADCSGRCSLAGRAHPGAAAAGGARLGSRCGAAAPAAAASPRGAGGGRARQPGGGGRGSPAPALGPGPVPAGACSRHSDHAGDDQEWGPLAAHGRAGGAAAEAAAPPAPAKCAAAAAAAARRPRAGFDWHRDVEACKQELEALTSLMAGP
jgi:hypothetical protein